MKTEFSRQCPKCNETIYYKSALGLYRALKDDSRGKMRVCYSCSNKNKNSKTGTPQKVKKRIADFLVKLENCGDECIEFDNGRKTRSWGNEIIKKHVMPKFHGKRPKGMIVRHLCLNDSGSPNGFTCCNPKHIEWNTHATNVRDQWEWGVHARKKGKAKPPPK